MKRSQSSTPPSSSQITLESEDTPSKKPRVSSKKQQKETHTKSRAPSQIQPPHGGWPPGWDADKKEAIIERYLTLGIKSTNVNDMCQEFNLTKTQLGNAIQSGHKGNLRVKAAKGARSQY